MSQFRERSPVRRIAEPRAESGDINGSSFPPEVQSLEVVLIPATNSLWNYADAIERRLKESGLLTFVEVLRPGGFFPEAVDYWARRGAMYVIQLEEQHETHYSLTLNILHGTKQEHRNMPVDDALKMIKATSDNFFAEQFLSTVKSTTNDIKTLRRLATPRRIAYLLHLLADCRYLTVDELTIIVDYVDERRRTQAQEEGKILPQRKEDDQRRITNEANIIQARLVSMINQGPPTSNPTLIPQSPCVSQTMPSLSNLPPLLRSATQSVVPAVPITAPAAAPLKTVPQNTSHSLASPLLKALEGLRSIGAGGSLIQQSAASAQNPVAPTPLIPLNQLKSESKPHIPVASASQHLTMPKPLLPSDLPLLPSDLPPASFFGISSPPQNGQAQHGKYSSAPQLQLSSYVPPFH